MSFKDLLRTIYAHDGRRLWDATTEHTPGQRLTAYVIKSGTIILVHDYGGDRGWEIYIPACTKNDVAATLLAAGLGSGTP